MTRVAELLADLDSRELQLRLRLDCYADGYRNGFRAGAEVGRGQALTEEAEQRREAAGMIRAAVRDGEAERRRWTLRGEPRTRATFSQPHPDDFPGRGTS